MELDFGYRTKQETKLIFQDFEDHFGIYFSFLYEQTLKNLSNSSLFCLINILTVSTNLYLVFININLVMKMLS